MSLATAYGGASVGLSLLQYVFVVERARQVTSYVEGAMDGAVAGLAASVIVLLGAVGFLLGCAFPLVLIILANQSKFRRYYQS